MSSITDTLSNLLASDSVFESDMGKLSDDSGCFCFLISGNQTWI